MASRSYRRQVILFLAAILLPCVALVALGVRLVVQERELGTARLDDERRRVTRQLQQDLSSQLERIALRQAAALAANSNLLQEWRYDDSLVVLVARESEGQLTLPWESDGASGESQEVLRQGTFGQRIWRGEREEFVSENPASAIVHYQKALEIAQHPVEVSHARQLLARALNKAGRPEDAVREYRVVLDSSPSIVDENGVPYSLYAARQLLEAGRVDAAIFDCLRTVLAARRWPAPPALYLLRDLADMLTKGTSDAEIMAHGATLTEEVSRELGRAEQALALKADYSSLGLTQVDANAHRVGNRWIPYGAAPWLVGRAPESEQGNGVVVFAVRADPILASLESGSSATRDMVGEISLTIGTSPSGSPLGTAFPSVFIGFASTEGEPGTPLADLRWWFYSLGLFLIIGVTLFGAYLLWRDVRREVQLAETRSRFVSAVSHELKTPLTAIRMFAETLNEEGTVPEGVQGEYLETIVNESERLTRLLNNVLDFSKIERGKRVYRRELESLEDIVRFSARAMQYPLEQRRFALQVEIEDGIPSTQVDRDAIEQAILNLLANAIKYSGENREINLRLRAEDGEAVIEVTDRGLGIEPAELPRIFDQFYRTPSAENERIPGTGLGLTLVQHIAEGHDGRVEARSVPGKGTTFSMFIPLNGGDS